MMRLLIPCRYLPRVTDMFFTCLVLQYKYIKEQIFPCDSSVKHSCFGFNNFNVGLLEISTATVYRQVYQFGIGKTAFI